MREFLHQRKRERLLQEFGLADKALDLTKDELRALAASLFKTQEAEQRRIARELHDDLLQRLSVLEIELVQIRRKKNLTLESLRHEIHRLEQSVGKLSEHVRKLSHTLHPSVLDDLGLQLALETLLQDFQANRSESVTFTSSEVPEKIPPPIGTALYRITQEALHNISKHCGAVPVTVNLTGQNGLLSLTIQDEGAGFDLTAIRGKGSLGIISMQERAQLIGATLIVLSKLNQGTTIKLEVKIPEQTEPSSSF